MEKIKEAFERVKNDIFSLGNEVQSLKLELIDLKKDLKIFSGFLEDLREKSLFQVQNSNPTHNQKVPTIQHIIPTHQENPTHNLPSQALKPQNTVFSTGNEGVPTDRQTNQQTDRHIIQHINYKDLEETTQKTKDFTAHNQKIDSIEKASKLLENLDTLKKEIRRKFKSLTKQEMQVFSLLYSLEEQGIQADYTLLSQKLRLSESSIRDYIGKIQKKGININKEKINNKKIILHISQDLKKIASLDTILSLIEI